MSLGFGARAKSVISLIDFGAHSNENSTSSTGTGVLPAKQASTALLSDHPTPDQFEIYVPWVFAQWQCATLVAIAKRKQETYTPVYLPKRKLDIKIRSTTSKVLGRADNFSRTTYGHTSVLVKTSYTTKNSKILREEAEKYANITIPIEAFYDPLDNLVSLRIIDCPLKLTIELTRAFHICFPYQPLLTGFSVFKSPLSPLFLYDLGALLPLCSLTEILLDDNYVKEGNYYCLLDEASHLKFLSLKRCRINDVVVSKIIKRLVHGSRAEKNFALLDLTSNNITDVGAKLFGELLRKNRRITYLNLSGNMITDEGAFAILKHLKEYPLTNTEIMDINRKRMKYYQLRIKTYDRLLIEDIRRRQSMRIAIARGKSRALGAEKSTTAALTDRLNQMVGPFVDLYDENQTFIRNGVHYCIGNFRLACLNLAYNNISYMTVKELTNVLYYQSNHKNSRSTGLVRVVIEGNCLPIRCYEYSLINRHLNSSAMENVRMSVKNKRATLKASETSFK